ncbi:MAG: hypothetical protein WBR21_05780 [Rouxiella badensis]|uniref:hypothetical protein n=1 Tax=Rouxiella badensis TaxID=1646377 RepID=UPI003C6976EF
MSSFIKKMGYALISPQKIILNIVGGGRDLPIDNSQKYKMDRSGTIAINPMNADIQDAFRKNVQGLSKHKV